MEQYKEEYNNLLKRFEKGVQYLKNHPESFEKWSNELLDIVDQLDGFIKEHNIPEENILEGFK